MTGMSNVSSANSGLNLSTDRIAAGSRQQPTPSAKATSSASDNALVPSFRREVPLSDDAKFVEVDGNKYFLDVPRGTYLNILV